MASSYPVRTPAWSLHYTGKNITADVSGIMVEIAYDRPSIAHRVTRSHTQGPRPALAGAVVSGPGRSPASLDRLRRRAAARCGDFQIDAFELDGPPDTFHVRGRRGDYAAPRTPTSAGFENQTLGQSRRRSRQAWLYRHRRPDGDQRPIRAGDAEFARRICSSSSGSRIARLRFLGARQGAGLCTVRTSKA